MEGRAHDEGVYPRTYIDIPRLHIYVSIFAGDTYKRVYIYIYIYIYIYTYAARRNQARRGRISRPSETDDVDKQTCRRPRGHGKHDGVGVGGAVKREIRVYPPARFSIVRSAAFARITMEIDLPGRKLSEAGTQSPRHENTTGFSSSDRARTIHSIPLDRACVYS